MSGIPRRTFLQAGTGVMTALGVSGIPAAVLSSSSKLSIAPFRLDVTAPVGHGCCGGWIKPIEAVDDTQEAIGFVLLGAGAPIVVCAVDWTGILNRTHLLWRTAMAAAAGTTPDRAAVQCVHQHNAPFACLDAQNLVSAQGDLPNIMLPDFLSSASTVCGLRFGKRYRKRSRSLTLAMARGVCLKLRPIGVFIRGRTGKSSGCVAVPAQIRSCGR